MSYTVVIPARYASTRLPGKPLVDIAGKPMIAHVLAQAKRSNAERVVVATDDERIFDAVFEEGAECVMTRSDHPSGTDRLQEVADILQLSDDDLIVNVQGDEPLLPPSLIEQVAQNLSEHQDASIATLCERIHDLETVLNPNAVKVVFDAHGYANYFSRAPIPWPRDTFGQSLSNLAGAHMPEQGEYYRHIGMYAYRVGFLHDYVRWSPSMTEQCESLEQLRALSNGAKIHVDLATETPPAGVDTEDDLERVRALLS